MTNLAHITVTKTVDGKPVTKARYHTICEMDDAGDALSPESAKLLAKYQAANKAATAAREAFESHMREHDLADATVDVEGIGNDLPLVPAGCEAVFGYNFGRVAVAAIKSTERKGKAKAVKTALKLKAKAAPVETPKKPADDDLAVPAVLIRKGKKV